MTLPRERLNALVRTREFLLELNVAKHRADLLRLVRRRAKELLRHYPSEGLLKHIAERLPTFLLAEERVPAASGNVDGQKAQKADAQRASTAPEFGVVFAEFAGAVASDVTDGLAELFAGDGSSKALVRRARELALMSLQQQFERLYVENDEASHRRRVLLMQLLLSYEMRVLERAER